MLLHMESNSSASRPRQPLSQHSNHGEHIFYNESDSQQLCEPPRFIHSVCDFPHVPLFEPVTNPGPEDMNEQSHDSTAAWSQTCWGGKVDSMNQ